MTISELHIAFKIELDKLDISGYPSFLAEEIDHWLNKAYLMVINQKFTGGQNQSKPSFEQTQKRISDLVNLVVSAENNKVTCGGSPSIGEKEEDFLYFIDGELIYKNKLINGETVISNVVPLNHSNYDKFKKTRTNNPVIIDPVLIQDSDGFKIFYDEFSVFPLAVQELIPSMSFKYRYIKQPEKISISTPNASIEISEHVHQEIVALAVFLAIENIESSRVQSNAQLLNIQE